MLNCGLPLGDHAPVWAWKNEQSGGHWQSRFSAEDIYAGLVCALIEFTPSHNYWIESSYDRFTDLWWEMQKPQPELSAHDKSVFALGAPEDVQVVLPWLCRAEITGVSRVTLRPMHQGGPIIEQYGGS
jgi:hypothetical protein